MSKLRNILSTLTFHTIALSENDTTDEIERLAEDAIRQLFLDIVKTEFDYEITSEELAEQIINKIKEF